MTSNWQTPEFIQFSIKHGLLNANAGPMEAYTLEGFLLRDEETRQKRLKLGLSLPFVEILKALTPAELAGLKERVAGVLPFRSKQ